MSTSTKTRTNIGIDKQCHVIFYMKIVEEEKNIIHITFIRDIGMKTNE